VLCFAASPPWPRPALPHGAAAPPPPHLWFPHDRAALPRPYAWARENLAPPGTASAPPQLRGKLLVGCSRCRRVEWWPSRETGARAAPPLSILRVSSVRWPPCPSMYAPPRLGCRHGGAITASRCAGQSPLLSVSAVTPRTLTAWRRI
jgi:hypothetical protein